MVLAGAVGAAACAPDPIGTRHRREALLIGGASAMLPLTTALAQALMRERGAPAAVIERGGSLPAYIAASRHVIDVAAMTRALSDNEDSAGAHQYLIARGRVDIVVNRALSVAGLSQSRLRALLTGEVKHWAPVGGPDLPVTVYVHARGAAARACAEQVVLDGGEFGVDARECAGDAKLLAAVAADPGAIACIDASACQAEGSDQGQLARLAIDGVAASHATVLTERYPFTYSFYLLRHGRPGDVGDAFIRFARSAAGQAIVARHGLVGVC